jgi:eukaryotic-like serine/threonine-protein kinase
MISFLLVTTMIFMSVAAITLLLHSLQKEVMAESMKNSNTLADSDNTKSTTDNSSFLTYKNFVFGILIQYPSTWEKVEPEDVNVRRFGDDSSDKQIVEFKSPLDRTSDKYQVGLSISVHNLRHSDLANLFRILDKNQNTPLKSFTLTHLTTLSTKLPGFEFIKPESTDITLANSNNPAHEIVYTYRAEPQSSTVIKGMDAMTIRDDKGYIIRYSAAPANYSRYLPIVQKMMDSFNIIK